MRDPLLLFISVSLLASCSPGRKDAPPDWRRVPVSIELRLARSGPGPQLVPAQIYGRRDTVYLDPQSGLSHTDVARVEATKTMTGSGLVLDVWLTQAGARSMADLTAHHIGDKLAVLVNSVVVSVPPIQDTLNLGTKSPSIIGVPLGPEESRQLALAISKTWPRKGGTAVRR